MKKEKKEKNSIKTFVICLIISILTIVGITIIVLLNNYPKADENQMIKISQYLKSNSVFYDGLHKKLEEKETIYLADIDDLEKNKAVAAYLITEGNASDKYNYDNCKECYNEFSKYDNIYFYNPKDVEDISTTIFGENIKKITQNDLISYNILYYNKQINMYYMNIVYLRDYANSVFEPKEYKQEKNHLYFDYYYGSIISNNNSISITKINGLPLISNINYKDLFENETSPLNYLIYKDNYQVIRYSFKYNKKEKNYILDSIKIIFDGKTEDTNVQNPIEENIEEKNN